MCLAEKPTKTTYSYDLKKEIVDRSLAGESWRALAEGFWFSSPNLVKSRVLKYRVEGEDGLRAKPKGSPKGDSDAPCQPASELERVQRENAWLRAENAYPKNAGLEGSGAALKTRAIATLKNDHDISVLLDIAGIARSTCYYHLARLNRADAHAELKIVIRQIFDDSKSRYGHRRIHIELRKRGWRVAKKTVLKTMQALGLKPKTRSRKCFYSYKGDIGKIAPNLLNREFFADHPNQKWVTDVTEFKVGEAKLYFSPILDLRDRSIVAFSTSRHPTVEFAVSSLRDALEQLPEHASLLVHSDQEFHYQHANWQQCLAAAGAMQSMSRKGNWLDNAVMENFFGHLKEEMFHHDSFDSIEELEAEIHAYIAWYNTERVSLTLEGTSPMQYRAHALAA